MVLARGLDFFPSQSDRLSGTIDVWWIMHDGGLLLLLAHLLRQHHTWAGCRLRVHTVAGAEDNSILIKQNLEKLLEQVCTALNP